MNSLSFNLAAAGFAVTLAAAMLRLRESRRQQWPFAAALVTAAIAIASITLNHSTLRVPSEALERAEMLVGFAIGPLLLLYARRSTPLVHFLPAAIAFAFIPPIELMLLHQFTYTGLTAFVAFREEEMLWPRRLVIAFGCVHVAQIIRFTFHDVAALRNIVPITLSLGIMALALVRFAPPSVKYRKAPLPAERPELFLQLDASMREQRLYLDPSLSLQSFAQRTGVSPHHVSRALSASGSSFYEYVNRFRIAEACARLEDPASERITVDALAEAAGFSSRSSFYAAFRKAMGMTPTEYRRRTLSNPAETDKVAATAL